MVLRAPRLLARECHEPVEGERAPEREHHVHAAAAAEGGREKRGDSQNRTPSSRLGLEAGVLAEAPRHHRQREQGDEGRNDAGECRVAAEDGHGQGQEPEKEGRLVGVGLLIVGQDQGVPVVYQLLCCLQVAGLIRVPGLSVERGPHRPEDEEGKDDGSQKTGERHCRRL